MEKRLYPRVKRQFTAVVENGDGAHIKVVATDTSSDGLCIQCNISERNLITPGGCFVRDDGKPVELFVWMELPLGIGGAEKIGARCHVVFSRRISSDQCQVGVRYMDLDQSGHETLIAFMESVNLANEKCLTP